MEGYADRPPIVRCHQSLMLIESAYAAL